jgi:hypothetical protein
MVYQITEKNQILIALFAIVVLCAGKLFKDYLYRSGYVEGLDGLIVSTSANTPMSRPANGTKLFQVYFTVKIPADLGSNAVIKVELPADKSSDVTLSSNASEYSAKKIVGGAETDLPLITSPPQPVHSASGTRQISWTLSSRVDAGTIVKISIPGTLSAKSSQTGNESFGPFNVYAGTESESKSISIVKSGGVSTSESTSTSAIEIRNAINTINTRLETAGISDSEATSLYNARSALVTVLAYTYGTVKEAGKVFDSDALYEAQRTAMEFIQREKERAKNNATALKEDNSNKRRMAQVNTYYTRNYEANTEVMKNIIYISVALIILAILRNKELIPSSISTLGVIFILMMGGIVVGSQVFDIIRRNDHDFDKYDWSFNEEEMNKKQILQQNSDGWAEMGSGLAPCYGPSCCDVGTTWNNDAKKCVASAGYISGIAIWTPSSGAGSLTISLKVSTALVSSDTITITIPPGLFTGTPVISGSNFTGTPSVSAPFTLTVAAGGVSVSGAVPDIVITGMSLSVSASYLSNKLKVKTSKDTNESGITISGVI